LGNASFANENLEVFRLSGHTLNMYEVQFLEECTLTKENLEDFSLSGTILNILRYNHL
jgi:hypothetical protein